MPFEGPFTTFNFRVELRVAGDEADVCRAEFSECDGLEMTMEPKTIRQGGDNGRQIHLVGPVSYGQLTLKRGVTADLGLWDWFERTVVDGGRGLRASGRVEVLSADRTGVGPDADPPAVYGFALTGCVPIKVRAPSMSGKDGQIAIEEMQIAYETLRRLRSLEEGGGQAS